MGLAAALCIFVVGLGITDTPESRGAWVGIALVAVWGLWTLLNLLLLLRLERRVRADHKRSGRRRADSTYGVLPQLPCF